MPLAERFGGLGDRSIRWNVERFAHGVSGVTPRYRISNRRYPRPPQRLVCSSLLPCEGRGNSNGNCTGSSLCMCVGNCNFGTHARLVANNTQGLIGEECSER
jgi:hypothetical protein